MVSIYGDRSFKLTENFLSQYKGKQPDWGYGALSYITYLRTYSRRANEAEWKRLGCPDSWPMEEYWQTCQRVVEGVINIQKTHCKRIHVPWDNHKAHKTAKEMFQRMWEFKWLPPGRGLWMMGTDHIEKVGSGALNNCSAVTTADIGVDFARAFCWLMDFSMLGVGVGFDTEGAGKITLKAPKSEERVYTIPDTREGWVDSLRQLLLSYSAGSERVNFDYTKIRGPGSPIKGFGGVSSGPQPLVDLHKNLTKLLDTAVGVPLTSAHIVDICNFIAKCVVSGNIRRSALIGFGDISDSAYLELKDPEKYSFELQDRRWSSNNSVVCAEGDNYSEVALYTAKNGEPGYFWRENAQKYGRLKDGVNNKDHRATLTNPCQPAWAPVQFQNRIGTIGEVEERDLLHADGALVPVYKKWCTGTKDVWAYHTSAGTFYGTPEHKVLDRGVKVPVKDAEFIDVPELPIDRSTPSTDWQAVADGLFLGDGTCKTQKGMYSYNLLCVGEKDQDYFSIAELGDYIEKVPFDRRQHKIATTFEGTLPKTYEREVEDKYFYAESHVVRSFLLGLYSANGSICGNRVTLKQSSLKLVRRVQMMLSSIGIRSYYTINKSKNVNFSNGEYTCRESYDLNISSSMVVRFKHSVGFLQEYKKEKLAELSRRLGATSKPSRCKTSYPIISAEYVSTEKVYDITVASDKHVYNSGGLVVSNCGEITLEDSELCNLSESFPAKHETVEDYHATLKFAYLYSKTITLIPTHSARTNAVMLRNRRIGMSQSGIAQAITKFGLRTYLDQICDKGYDVVQHWDKIYSEWLCVPESIKTTAIKPSGSISLLAGATPGIHFPHSKHYIRRMRIAKTSSLLPPLIEAGYKVEEDVYGSGAMVVEFPTKEENCTKSKFDVSMWEQLELAAQIQHYWADNQVSCTVTFPIKQKSVDGNEVPDHEGTAEELAVALSLYESRLKGISFLPLMDHSYAQAPYEEITEEQYTEMSKGIKEVDLGKTEHEVTEMFCDGGACEVV